MIAYYSMNNFYAVITVKYFLYIVTKVSMNEQREIFIFFLYRYIIWIFAISPYRDVQSMAERAGGI